MENPIINGRYRILQQIGVGGFGLTYLAEDLQLQTRPKCVVKHLRPQINDAETLSLANRLFQQEAEILYLLGGHPNIPSLIAHFKEDGEFFLVQAFIEGHTIDREFTGGRKYNQKEIIQFLGQTLEILSFVHSQKVIHRDVKPTNLIRRNSDGSIFLIDFGAVKQVNSVPQTQNGATFSTVTIGSHGYMPMEQMAGKPNFSSDLYALGLVAIEALIGIKPLDLPRNATTNEIMWTHKVQLSPELERFISKLVRMDFRQRYPSAVEALAVLNSIASSIGFFAVQPQNIMTVQPITTNQNFQPIDQSIQKPQIIPPTIIVPSQNFPLNPPRNYQTNHLAPPPPPNKSSAKGVLLGIVGLFFFFGFLFVVGKILNFNWRSFEDSREDSRQISRQSDLKPSNDPSLSLFNEAIKQANEAAEMEQKATTRFEWEQIGSKYKRAAALLASIDSKSPDYSAAQEKGGFFKQKAAFADEQAIKTPEASTLNTDVPLVAPSPAAASQSSPSNSPARVRLTMPPKPAAKSFLVYNADYGYSTISKADTSDEYNFRSRISRDKYSSVAVNTVEVSGGGSSIIMSPPTGVEKLRPGTYQALQAEYGRAVGNYTIRLNGFHCNQESAHSFTINEIVYDEVYQNVSYLDATFSLNCGDRKAFGRVRYDAR